jgi:hypothetical protein
MTQETTSVDLEDVTETETQATRSYTQKEFDDAMAKTKTSIIRKFEKKYEELGDIEELRKIKSDFEQKQKDDQIKRGDFEKVLQDIAAKKDAEILKRDTIIRDYKIETPIVSAAAKHRAIDVDQVKSLLINQVKLTNDGDVEVVDNNGAVRYSDSGTKLSVDDLVKEFLNKNTHFILPTPATTHTKTNVALNGKVDLDVTKLNMNDPADRELYKQYRKTNKIG